jgi:hypothetical protein
MDLTSYSQRLLDIGNRRQNRMIEATAQYMQEMRAIVTEAETDTRMATDELLGEDAISGVDETSTHEIARGLFA